MAFPSPTEDRINAADAVDAVEAVEGLGGDALAGAGVLNLTGTGGAHHRDLALPEVLDAGTDADAEVEVEVEAGARDGLSADPDDLADLADLAAFDALDDVKGEGVARDTLNPAPRHLAGAGILPELAQMQELPEHEATYARAARAPNTLRGYRWDWRDFTTWCAAHQASAMPATPATLSGYLAAAAQAGAKVGTLSRRLSSIKFAHASAGHPDPASHPRVMAIWEGIRRVHGAPPDQALPLMPPLLFDVLAACPSTRTWPLPAPTTTTTTASGHPRSSSPRTPRAARAPEADLAGARDRALLLVGFVGALRRSELAALEVADVAEHPNGLVLSLPRSKTNQNGEHTELVVLPRAGNPDRCPVLALARWWELANITSGPVFRGVSKANRAGGRGLHPESVNVLVQRAIERTGTPAVGYSAHSLRAGFVTYAHLRGSSERAIAHQSRHRSMASVGGYVRVSHAWTDNAATSLGL